MSYPYGTKGPAGAPSLGRAPAGMSAFPVVGNGLPGLPKRGGEAGEFIFEHTRYPASNVWEWTVPPGVTSISVIFVTEGGGGLYGGNGSTYSSGSPGAPGDGGKVYYRNDITVVPGQVIRFGSKMFNELNVTTAFTLLGSAMPGQWGSWGGLSTPGAQGLGGMGVNLINGAVGDAGFDPVYGGLPPMYGGMGGGKFGGGGGGGGGGAQHGGYGLSGGPGHYGGLRIIWPGDQRKFPDTRTRPE